MVNNLSQVIDLAINKKLSQGVAVKNNVKELVKYSRYNFSKKYYLNYLTHSFKTFELRDSGLLQAQRDIYNNQFYNYLKVRKTQCRFNLIKMFQPGELLHSVMSS